MSWARPPCLGPWLHYLSISLLEYVGVLGVVEVDAVLDEGIGVGGWGEGMWRERWGWSQNI